LGAVQRGNGRFAFFFRGHFDKTKTPGPSGIFVGDDFCRIHVAMLDKQIR